MPNAHSKADWDAAKKKHPQLADGMQHTFDQIAKGKTPQERDQNAAKSFVHNMQKMVEAGAGTQQLKAAVLVTLDHEAVIQDAIDNGVPTA